MKKSPLLSHYWYDLPDELIAKIPADPRDSARLMVYDTKTDEVTFDTFANLATYLPEKSLMVMNNTHVLPARVYFRKETGGKVEGLILLDQGVVDGLIPVITRHTKLSEGQTLFLGEHTFTVAHQDGQYYFVKPAFDIADLHNVVKEHGTTPTPYYIGKMDMDEEELRLRYQTVYAKEDTKASVAAPTASLHFTDTVFNSLDQRGIARSELTLHVGLGTFAPVTDEHLADRKLHTEYFTIPPETIREIVQAKMQGAPIIGVGTTTTRALESSTLGRLNSTDLFITPPFAFRTIDHLITNFHVPQSSLMCLVDAFLQHKGAKRGIVELYRLAIENKMRFFSFGDAMLIL